ncbi:PEP/pyruvate-binding domain-containing protein [Luteococcus sp. Sow4_B9]|uniref:PEP/pyruvate-binding domain-containing protein n=1 Tax=Luteococcus sp. Sow4_B9 TaxID=3438792 RepID=UPI003F95922B
MAHISWFDQQAERTLVGGKGGHLADLVQAGFPVPRGFTITTQAYRHHLSAPGVQQELAGLLAQGDAAGIAELLRRPLPQDLADEVLQAWAELGSVPVAVRSSSTTEDLAGASAAGQQDSYLNIRDAQDLLDAVRDCFASLWNERAIVYRAQHGVDQSRIQLAVVVQEMVPADAAGVLFTTNPLTGRPDEMLISANYGLGDQTVHGGGADQLVVGGGAVIARELAEKTHRTVPAPQGRGTVDVAVERSQRKAQALPDEKALELAALGSRIADHFGSPQDIEWVLAADRLMVVQTRAITALPSTMGPIPETWPVSDDKAMYVRAALTEQLPDPLSPLFADMVRPAVAGAVRSQLVEYYDEVELRPEDVDFPTVNGYAYYYYSREGMLNLLKRSPQAVSAIAGRSTFNADDLWGKAYPAYREVVEPWQGRSVERVSSVDLVEAVQELLTGACTFHGAVQALVPLAASAELPFTRLYAGLARQVAGPPAATFLQGFESPSTEAARSLWQIAQWCAGQPGLAAAVRSGASLAELRQEPSGAEFATRLARHLDEHGLAVENLDFMAPLPADDPAAVLAELQGMLAGTVPDPDAELARQAEGREAATQELLERLDPARKAILQPLLVRAQQVGPTREKALMEVGLAWPVMRRMLLTLGARLVKAGCLDEPADVFWLRHDELAELARQLDDGLAELPNRREELEARRVVWRGQRAANPPQLLPRNAWHRMFHRLVPAMETQQHGPVIKGLGVSQGRITAVARVIRGPEDFERMQPGEVIVSPITTPEWTPLYAMAAAVVTDVGGPLSHSSIVAREYAVPAVLGTGIATRRIRTGMLITVDADRGTVTLPEGEAPIDAGFRPKVPYKFAIGGVAAAAALVLRRVL